MERGVVTCAVKNNLHVNICKKTAARLDILRLPPRPWSLRTVMEPLTSFTVEPSRFAALGVAPGERSLQTILVQCPQKESRAFIPSRIFGRGISCFFNTIVWISVCKARPISGYSDFHRDFPSLILLFIEAPTSPSDELPVIGTLRVSHFPLTCQVG